MSLQHIKNHGMMIGMIHFSRFKVISLGLFASTLPVKGEMRFVTGSIT
jgi:hypothetical protein